MEDNKEESIVDKLMREVSKTSAEAKKYRLQRKESQAELVKLQAEHEAVKSELAKLLSDPIASQLLEVKQKVRERDHKDAFHAVAKDLKVREEAYQDLWNLSGYKAETDLPDPEALKASIGEALKSRPYLVASAEVVKPEPKTVVVQHAASRSGGTFEGVGFTVRKSDMLDQAFVKQNSAKIAEATKNNTIVFVD